MKKVQIYSDGGARPNPGPGGYGVILRFGKQEKELSGFDKHTTNNRMELTGVIKGLEQLKESCNVEIFTDSSYVVNGIEKGWAEKWQNNNWLKSDKKKAENSDLWEQLLDLLKKHKVKFHWVKGHAGHEENERCDKLATSEILNNATSPLAPDATSPLAPLLSGEGDGLVSNIIVNYKNVPGYVKDLSRKLRQDGTKSEEILWEILRNRKLNGLKFRRQHPFGRYIVDFYSNDLKLVIELDGGVHNIFKQKEYDKIRDEIISKYKVNILRVKNEEIYNDIEGIIKKILSFKTPSPDRRGLGGGCIGYSNGGGGISGKLEGDHISEETVGKLNIKQKKIKITKENQACKKCGTPVLKAIPKKKNTKNKSYYYEYYLTCPNCKTNYFVDEAKVYL